MNFKEPLISGEFIKRYKRFFVDIKIGNETVVAHCPNTGSMMGLLKEGNQVWLSKSDNPMRKLKYTLQIIEDKNSKIGVNTHLTNKIVLYALNNKKIESFKNIKYIKQEVNFGKNTRFDFMVSDEKKKSKKDWILIFNKTESFSKTKLQGCLLPFLNPILLFLKGYGGDLSS